MYDESKVKSYIPVNIEDIMHSAYPAVFVEC